MTISKRSRVSFLVPVGAALLLLLAFFFALPGGVGAAPSAPQQVLAPQAASVFINELHYDNNGSDSGEGAEVAGPAGTDLSGWSLVAYNGGTGGQYNTVSLSGVIPNLQNGYGAVFFSVSGLQNGAPDGIALVDNTGTVVQFLSYEGSFTASDGPAAGMTSTDIGVSEGGSTPAGYSLQLQGSGSVYADFTWAGPIASTYDAVNTGQTFVVGELISDLTIAKTGPLNAFIGSDLVYSITVSSQGMTSTNVTVTDTLPMSTTFAGASITYTTPSAGVYVFSLGNVVSGTQISFVVTATSSMSATAGQVLTNTATVHTDALGDDPANNTVDFTTSVYPLVSMHDIQYVADPATSDASPYSGQNVYVEGIVTAAPGELGSRALVIEDAAGGPWSGLYVYDSGNFSGLSAVRGDLLRVFGKVTEYYGMTELQYTSAEVLSTGNTVPTVTVINTGDFVNAATAEQWETVLIEFQNATVTNENLGYGEWAFDDVSGATRADDLGAFTYVPALGDYYDFIRGIGWYSYGNYKLEPRDDADISLAAAPADLSLSKSGPAYAFAGQEIAYTLQIHNPLLVPVNNVVLTDTLPVSVTNVISASNALTATNLGTQIVWQFGNLGANVTETVFLTATLPYTVSNGFVLTNNAVVTTTSTDDPANNSAAVNTTVYPIVPIATVRGGNDGDVFAVEGKVIVTPGTYNSTEWALQDASGGISVYYNPPPSVNLGDTIRLIGTRGSYKGQEQFTNALVFMNLGSGPEVSPIITSTGKVDSGSTEGWLVQVSGTASGLNCPGDRSFYVDDGSGSAYVYVDADTGADVCALGAMDGDTLTVVGFSTEYNGTFEIKPRRPADLQLTRSAPTIFKTAPSNVAPGATFTYTITVENYLGMNLTNLVITDSVPLSLTNVSPLDGGVYANGIVTWTLASLADQGTVSVRFAADAPTITGTIIDNENYAVSAAEWTTPTFGQPVFTVVGDYTPIPVIQGDGLLSPFEEQTVKTHGVVVGFFQGNSSAAGNFNGFFIQDPNGDDNPDTSDAIFVNYGTSSFSGISVGDMVEVSGQVQEFSEYDGAACYGDDCLTQISAATSNIAVLGSGTITPTTLTPLGDPVSSTLYFESLEGMLVTIPNTATVVGPTSYGTIQVVPGSLGTSRVLRGGPYEGMPVGVRPDERYGSGAPDLIVGSVISGVDGPLTFSYGDYLIADQDGYTVVSEATPPETPPSWPAVTPFQFSAATMNTLNFDSADPALKTTKMVSQVLQMNAPTFIAVEEIDAAGVMSDVLAGLSGAGYTYDFAYSHPDVGGHGVALMWRTDMVSGVVTSTAYQSCSTVGSPSSTYDPLWGTCQASGQYPLFSRRPVVVTATVQLASGPQQMVVIANHFKSKRGGASADQRRLEQAQFVHDLVAQFEDQTPYVLVMGDLNDFEDSPTVQALYVGDVLTSTWYSLPPEQRYSYVYLGVSQILDHILVSPALMNELVGMSPMHFNADYPYGYTNQSVIWRNSDHDPVVATFEFLYKTILPVIFNQYTP